MIGIDSIEFVSGQEPDGLDDDWSADMAVRGYITGQRDVAKLLGVQGRMVERKLPKTSKATLINRIAGEDNAISRELLKKIGPRAASFAHEYGLEEFERGGYVIAAHFLDSQDMSAVSISELSDGEPRIDFEIEISTLGGWGNKPKILRRNPDAVKLSSEQRALLLRLLKWNEKGLPMPNADWSSAMVFLTSPAVAYAIYDDEEQSARITTEGRKRAIALTKGKRNPSRTPATPDLYKSMRRDLNMSLADANRAIKGLREIQARGWDYTSQDAIDEETGEKVNEVLLLDWAGTELSRDWEHSFTDAGRAATAGLLAYGLVTGPTTSRRVRRLANGWTR